MALYTDGQMPEELKLGTEYRYHLMDDLPGKVGGAFIQDPRRLCYEGIK